MAQHPVQIHIVVSTNNRMATRAYCRDENGWYAQPSATDHCEGSPVRETEDEELVFHDSQEAVADALMAIHAAFGLMLAPGERLPDLVPVSANQGSTLN